MPSVGLLYVQTLPSGIKSYVMKRVIYYLDVDVILFLEGKDVFGRKALSSNFQRWSFFAIHFFLRAVGAMPCFGCGTAKIVVKSILQ